jgi:hypothetical protein
MAIGQAVADGYADWEMHNSGDIRVRFKTGESFLLAGEAITRLS